MNDNYKEYLSYKGVALKRAFLFYLSYRPMSVAAENSTDPVLELSHATVPAKSLLHAHVNEVAVVVF